MTPTPHGSPYAVPLEALVRSVHVRQEDLRTAQPAPPASGPLSAEELDRLLLLGVTGAGRLHLP